MIRQGGRRKVVRELNFLNGRKEEDNVVAEGGGLGFRGLLLSDVNGFADSAAVFRSKGELDGFEEGLRGIGVVFNHVAPGKDLQEHPWQLDGKQRRDEQESGCGFVHG